MNSPLFERVVEKILNEAACPRCGAGLRDCDYDRLELNNKHLLIELDCDRCESVLTLEGIFQRTPKKQDLPRVIVSPETVRDVGTALRSFHGKDIKELLGQ